MSPRRWLDESQGGLVGGCKYVLGSLGRATVKGSPVTLGIDRSVLVRCRVHLP